MSFIKIQSLLISAFSRIDRATNTQVDQVQSSIREGISSILPISANDSVEYKKNTIIIFSSSQILKQKIFIQKNKAISILQSKYPHLHIQDILFKGPK